MRRAASAASAAPLDWYRYTRAERETGTVSLVQAADQALHDAQGSGRNRSRAA